MNGWVVEWLNGGGGVLDGWMRKSLVAITPACGANPSMTPSRPQPFSGCRTCTPGLLGHS